MEDKSIVFPEFHARPAVMVDESGQPYELEGVTLRALAIAANDFLPPDSKDRSCWSRQEAHLYRVIRQGNIIFVSIEADPTACERKFLMLDDGVRYAISTDGRILRRLFTGEPGVGAGPSDAGGPGRFAEPVPDELVGSTNLGPSSFIPLQWRDGGVGPVNPVSRLPSPALRDGGEPADAGAPSVPAR
jgi:hypothetical protein